VTNGKVNATWALLALVAENSNAALELEAYMNCFVTTIDDYNESSSRRMRLVLGAKWNWKTKRFTFVGMGITSC